MEKDVAMPVGGHDSNGRMRGDHGADGRADGKLDGDVGPGDADEGVHERSLGSPWTAAAGTASMSAGRRATSSSRPARSTTASNAITGVKEAADHVLEVAKTEMKQRADDLGEGT